MSIVFAHCKGARCYPGWAVSPRGPVKGKASVAVRVMLYLCPEVISKRNVQENNDKRVNKLTFRNTISYLYVSLLFFAYLVVHGWLRSHFWGQLALYNDLEKVTQTSPVIVCTMILTDCQFVLCILECCMHRSMPWDCRIYLLAVSSKISVCIHQ